MKRIILIVITVYLLLTVCGCSSNNDELENDIETLKNDNNSIEIVIVQRNFYKENL